MMSSIRNGSGAATFAKRLASVALLAAGMLDTGCAHHTQPRPYEVSQPAVTAEPMYTDEAMRQRDWAPSTASFANGTVQAFATRWPYEGQETRFPLLNGVLDPVIFLTQAAILPVRMALVPPGTLVNYNGQVMQPTYSAMPPLPPEPLPENEPKPHPRRVVAHQPYRPFGALRDFFGNIGKSEKPAPKRAVRSTTPAPSRIEPMTMPEPVPAEPTTQTQPATSPAESAPPVTQ
jgi:hypothetical protein